MTTKSRLLQITWNHALHTSTAVFALIICTCAVLSTKKATAQNQPSLVAEAKTADEVFDRYARAVGGSEMINKITSRVTKGKMDVGGFGVSGTVETYQKAPNQFSSSTLVVGFKSHQVYDGKSGWLVDPRRQDVKEFSGVELESMKHVADLHLPGRMKEHYPKAKLKGKEHLESGEAYLVEIAVGDEVDLAYFDTKTGLLVRSRAGKGRGTDCTFSDYREVDGVKIPFLTTQTMGKRTITIKTTEVKHNVDIPASRFNKPIR